MSAVTTTGAMHAPTAPMKKTVPCESKFDAVAMAIGITFPMNAKRIARRRWRGVSSESPWENHRPPAPHH